MYQDRKTRAGAALKLVRHCVAMDDQAGFDLLSSVIAREGLFEEYSDDDGQSFTCMSDFLRDLEAEGTRTAGSIHASASPSHDVFVTAAGRARYAARMAALRVR